MKRYSFFLTILLFIGGFAFEVKAQELELTTKLISKRYCATDPDIFLMHVILQLRYTNVGKQTLIVPKGDLITYSRIGRSAEEIVTKGWWHAYWISSGNGDMPNLGSKPDWRFCVLKPGESCEIESSNLNIIERKRLDAGEHLLQVIVPVWNGTDKQAYKLRDRWKKFGFVWLDAVTSKPMTFLVEEEPKMVDCS